MNDPRLELPLEPELEKLIEQVGARRYLMGMISNLGVKLSAPVETLSDEECHKVCRSVIRGAQDYGGKELFQ